MRALRLSLLAVLGAAAFAVPASGQSRTESGFDLVRLNPSTRAAALAGAGAILGDDPTAAFYNPALLSSAMDGAAALSYTNHVEDVSAGAASYARDLPVLGGFTGAVAVRFLSYGEFERRTGEESPDDAVDTFSAGEMAATFSAAREVLPQVRVGVNVHTLFASIDDARARAITADVGATLDVPSHLLTLGASVHHVGAVLSSLGATADRLPLDVRLTAAKRLRYVPLTVSVAAVDLHAFEGPEVDSSFARRAFNHLVVGGEFQLGPTLAVRTGYRPDVGSDLRAGERLSLAGVSLGAGIRLRRISVDYAYIGQGSFGGVHQFGVRTSL